MEFITFETCINDVLEMMHENLLGEHMEIYQSRDYVYQDEIANLGRLSNKDYTRITNYSEATWSKKFKDKYGYTDTEYLAQVEKCFRASLTEGERALIDHVSNVGCCAMMFNECGKIGGVFWYSTPTKITYEPDTYTEGVYLKHEKASDYGMATIADIEDFLGRIGATKQPRPKHKRSQNYSIYD